MACSFIAGGGARATPVIEADMGHPGRRITSCYSLVTCRSDVGI